MLAIASRVDGVKESTFVWWVTLCNNCSRTTLDRFAQEVCGTISVSVSYRASANTSPRLEGQSIPVVEEKPRY